MKKLLFAAILAAALLGLIVAFAGAASQEKPFQATFAGSLVNKSDFSYTDVVTDSSSTGFFQGKSTLGNFTAQLVTTAGATGKDCAGANNAKGAEGRMKGSAYIFTFNDTGDQLFLQLNASKSSLYCGVTGVGTAGVSYLDVISGTGRFEGATGSLVKTWKAAAVAPPSAPGKGRLSTFTGSFDGTVVLASGKAWPF